MLQLLPVLVMALLMAAPSAAQATCDCEQEDQLSEPTPSGSCPGGVKCFFYLQENFLPIPAELATGRCENANVCPGVVAQPCKFNQYSIRIMWNPCASGTACVHTATTATITYQHAGGATRGTGINLPGGGQWPVAGSSALSFAQDPLNCGSLVHVTRVTVSAGGHTVFELQRRTKCNDCTANN